jgi:hypothetical protein
MKLIPNQLFNNPNRDLVSPRNNNISKFLTTRFLINGNWVLVVLARFLKELILETKILSQSKLLNYNR